MQTTRRQRASIWDQFSRVHRKVEGVHRKLELAVVAESVLGCAADGPIVEFGCFKGLSTIKLSLIAAQTGRVLYVYDSFQGSPAPHETETTDVETHQGEVTWARGDYASGLDEVVANVKRWGCLDACEFVPGFFDETLPGFDLEPAVVFEDVDLPSSVRTVLTHCVPRMPSGSVFFTHEAAFRRVVSDVFENREFWDSLGMTPPTLAGAGTGLHELAPALGYFKP